jgi:hypothetical protein
MKMPGGAILAWAGDYAVRIARAAIVVRPAVAPGPAEEPEEVLAAGDGERGGHGGQGSRTGGSRQVAGHDCGPGAAWVAKVSTWAAIVPQRPSSCVGSEERTIGACLVIPFDAAIATRPRYFDFELRYRKVPE